MKLDLISTAIGNIGGVNLGPKCFLEFLKGTEQPSMIVLHYQRSYHQNQPNTMLHFTIMLFLLFCSKIITEGPINIENILQFNKN